MADPADPSDGAAKTPAAVAELEAQVQRFRASIEAVRSRADLTAKALAALGTTALSALGIAKFADVYPLPPGGWDAHLVLATVASVGGFLLVAVAIALFTTRFWKVSSPIFVSSDLDEMKGELSSPQRKRAQLRYDHIARRRDAPSMRAYEARAERFDRLASSTDEPQRSELRAAAALIRAEVAAAGAHVGADAVRDRATQTLRGWGARGVVASFLVGLVAFGLGTDYLDGERKGRTEIAKECAAATKALQEQGLTSAVLPAFCAASPAIERSPEQTVALATSCAAAVKALDEQRLDTSRVAKACTDEARGDPEAPPAATSKAVVDSEVSSLGQKLGVCLVAAKSVADRQACARLDRALKAAAG
ncbi:MAG: hypothetical protein ACR2LK_06130 [Solirubrobacteraceae bacterium]